MSGQTSGTGPVLTVQRVEDCPNGHALFRIGGESPVHLITGDDVRSGHAEEKAACQDRMPRGKR